MYLFNKSLNLIAVDVARAAKRLYAANFVCGALTNAHVMFGEDANETKAYSKDSAALTRLMSRMATTSYFMIELSTKQNGVTYKLELCPTANYARLTYSCESYTRTAELASDITEFHNSVWWGDMRARDFNKVVSFFGSRDSEFLFYVQNPLDAAANWRAAYRNTHDVSSCYYSAAEFAFFAASSVFGGTITAILPDCKFLQKLKSKLLKLSLRGVREVVSNVSPESKFLFVAEQRNRNQYDPKDFSDSPFADAGLKLLTIEELLKTIYWFDDSKPFFLMQVPKSTSYWVDLRKGRVSQYDRDSSSLKVQHPCKNGLFSYAGLVCIRTIGDSLQTCIVHENLGVKNPTEEKSYVSIRQVSQVAAALRNTVDILARNNGSAHVVGGWRAAVAAMLINLDYTRVENKTDAQLRDIVCSNLGKNRYVITDAKGLDYANVLKF